MTARVLIVDDEANLRRMLRAVLEAEGHEVFEAADGDAALGACRACDADVVLLDLAMPPGPDGLETLEHLRREHDDLNVIMMSGKATLADAVRATKLGALQFLEKPLTPESVLSTVAAAAELSTARAENRIWRTQLGGDDEIVGPGPAMTAVRAQIAQVAGTATRVLVTGESGTGKELVARALHRGSPRSKRPMVSLNCAAVPRDLLESELFGHERGAFTGAVAKRQGRFELAHRSTLFLDEIGDMHQDAQAKLLRVLEMGSFTRLGGEHEREVDVRVIAATNKDLSREVERGAFREDLYFRLNVVPIAVPPLRERVGDLPALIAHLAPRIAARCTRHPRTFSSEALEQMSQHHWPGNVRELANVVERLTILGGPESVSREEVAAVLRGSVALKADPVPPSATAQPSLSGALEAYEARLIREALDQSGGNVSAAARSLQTDRANLHRRMRRLGVSRDDTNVS
jgi:two-component system nitrogen regulation response regulator NtrX